jgi:hypothetical protein
MRGEADLEFQPVPFFCEENAILAARSPRLVVDGTPIDPDDREVVFITNRSQSVAVWAQRTGDPVVWDYHVICVGRRGGRRYVFDPDCTAGSPLPAPEYLAAAFRAEAPAALAPMFRVCSRSDIANSFSSDRSHMRDVFGQPIRPFPPWSPLVCRLGPHTLPRFLALDDNIAGRWLSLVKIQQEWQNPTSKER